MATTYWPEIRKIEDHIEAGNAEELIDFIRFLGEKRLLTRYMLKALCDASYEPKPLWDALHEYASIVK